MRRYFQKLLRLSNHLVGINRRNLEYVYPYNPRKFFPLANDKTLSKQILEENNIPTPKTYSIISNLWEIRSKLEELSELAAFVVKPSQGSGGGGILILFKIDSDQWETPSGEAFNKEKLSRHIAGIIYGVYSISDTDKAIIEYCLTPHSFLRKIYDKGVPDFRIIVFKHHPIMAMLRIPTKKSGGKANLHQGAMGIGVDMEKGTLMDGYYKGRFTDRHPDSGNIFKGIPIPDWKEAVKIAERASNAFPLEYLGVDIVHDAELGPLIIEVNARPGLQIQNINNQGLNEVIQQKKII